MKQKRKVGFWILIGIGILLNVWFILGQTMAVIDYDFTVAIRMQDPPQRITEMGVAYAKGFGMGDTVIYIPLFILGIVGAIRRKAFGLFALIGAFGITAYWPIVCLAAFVYAKGVPGFHLTDYLAYSIVLPAIAMYGIWGIVHLYKTRHQFT